MSSVGKIEKKVGSRFLSYYEMEAVHRDGSVSPYYMVSRNPNPDSLKAVTHKNAPDGVVIYGLYQDKVVLVRQYRYPIGGFVYEFPAGLVEPGEDMEAAAIRELHEETGLTLHPIPCGSYGRPFFTTVGMTDESCGTVFGTCEGTPTSRHQEATEEIQVVLADKEECRRILKEEQLSIMCAYMLMHFVASSGDPFQFLKSI